MQALVSESRLIVVGVPQRNSCHQSQNGHITTDYQIQIQEVLKGTAQPNTIIPVQMPGGLITESNGNLLEARTRQIRKMQNGKKYIIFLKNAPGGGDTFATLRGSQGLYEIPPNGTRVIHLGRSFLLPPANDGEIVSVLLDQIRSLARNK
jgi:hypothetical protein